MLVATAAGLLLRFGIPVIATALVVLWLRRLDARWQVESKEVRIHVVNASEMARAPRCWEVRHCPPERMADCPARAQPDTPCWQVFRGADGQLKEACLDCDVFRHAPVPLIQVA